MNQLEKLEKELEDYKAVSYRMREEGIDYCFKHYSSWEEIEDRTFHTLKEEFLKSMNMLEEYVRIKIKVLENDIEKLEDE